MAKKVKIELVYASLSGLQFTEEKSAETIDAARQMIEKNLSEWDKPHLLSGASAVTEEEVEYDVTTFTKYSLSHINVTDYTENKK